MRRQGLLLAGLTLVGGCFPGLYQMYGGPRRSRTEVATLVSSGTWLESLDNWKLSYFSSQEGVSYEVLPGRHRLGISLFIVHYVQDISEVEQSPNIAVLCLDAEAGRTYTLGYHGHGDAWRPELFDDVTGQPVAPAPCDGK